MKISHAVYCLLFLAGCHHEPASPPAPVKPTASVPASAPAVQPTYSRPVMPNSMPPPTVPATISSPPPAVNAPQQPDAAAIQEQRELQVVTDMVNTYNNLVQSSARMEQQRVATNQQMINMENQAGNGDISVGMDKMDSNPAHQQLQNQTINLEVQIKATNEEALHQLENLRSYDLFRRHFREVVRGGYRFYERYQ